MQAILQIDCPFNCSFAEKQHSARSPICDLSSIRAKLFTANKLLGQICKGSIQ